MAKNARLRRERRLEAARGYLTLDMPGHAIRELNEIRDAEECPFVFHQLRGEALRQQEKFAEALSAFKRANAEEPADLSVLMGMAWCYKRTDQLSRAITAMLESYRTAPREPIVLYNLSCYFALAGNKTQALSWLGRAIRMEPKLRKLIPEESDFDRLRDDPDFQFMAGTSDVSDVT